MRRSAAEPAAPFRTRLETVPADVPYLCAPHAVTQRWKQKLAGLKGLKIGLVWAGNPEHVNDSRRSVDLAMLEPLFDIPGTSFVSLQYGSRTADLKKLIPTRPVPRERGRERAIENLGAQFEDFADTAAAVAALDLIITVDTSVAHLAGGLGKPVWVILPWVTDWRWLLTREDNPWYPTMRLFRQKRSNNAAGEEMADVIARSTDELRAVAQGDTARLTPFKEEGERNAAQAAAIIKAETARAAMPAPTPREPLNPAIPPGQALILAEQKRQRGFLADADELARRAAEAEPDNAEAAHMLGHYRPPIRQDRGSDRSLAPRRSRSTPTPRSITPISAKCAGSSAALPKRSKPAAAPSGSIQITRARIAISASRCSTRANSRKRWRFTTAPSRSRPNFVQAHSNRGNALQRLKRFADAEPSYRRAIELHPQFADAWNNLGTCLRELKRSDEAETAYRKALELAPNNPDTLDNLALALKDLERLDEAGDLLRRALVIESNSDKLYLHYGSVLLDQHKIAEASAAIERAMALNPNNHDNVNMMGRIAFDRGDLEDSLTFYQRALSLKPNLADAYNNMGNTLKELGKLTEAQDAYLEALRLDPEYCRRLYQSRRLRNLQGRRSASCRDGNIGGQDRRLVEDRPYRSSISPSARRMRTPRIIRVRSGITSPAMPASARVSLTTRPRAIGLFDCIEAVFGGELIKAKSGGGDPSTMPIFVIGMPRSGTTLIEQIVASHPLVHGAGELQTFNDVILEVRGRTAIRCPIPNS